MRPRNVRGRAELCLRWAACVGPPLRCRIIERRRWISAAAMAGGIDLQERALDVPSKGWSIRHRLMLLALAVALPFMLLTAGIVWQLANNERETRREAILFSTRTLMNAVDAILEQADRGGADAGHLAGPAGRRPRGVPPGGRARAPGLSGGWIVLSRRERPAARQSGSGRRRTAAAPAVRRRWRCRRRALETGQVQISDVFSGAVSEDADRHGRGAGAAQGQAAALHSPSSWSPRSSCRCSSNGTCRRAGSPG